MAFAFGDHMLDVERRELRRGGEPVAPEAQVFDRKLFPFGLRLALGQTE